MDIHFEALAEAMEEAGIIRKSIWDMTEEEIDKLCQIVHMWSQDDPIPF
jgi:hypothetical protein